MRQDLNNAIKYPTMTLHLPIFCDFEEKLISGFYNQFMI